MTVANLPRISVVTPSYQQAEYLANTIESVISQGYPNLEYIIIDGGSTDGSIEIIRKYSRHLAYFVSERDEGQAHAIINGFARASGNVCAWLNSDDTYEPGALLRVGEFFLQQPDVGFLYGDYNLIDESGRVLEHKKQPSFDLSIAKYAYMTIPQPAAFWRANAYRAVGGVKMEFKFSMDYDLFLRMAQITKVQHVAVRLANFRVHGRSKTATAQSTYREEVHMIRMSCCEVKPSSALFKFVKAYYIVKLLGRCFIEGCLAEKLINQIRRRVRLAIRS